jgi:hypothetical protein
VTAGATRNALFPAGIQGLPYSRCVAAKAQRRTMTELLERAFDEAAKLPRDEQDRLAASILEELAAERRWTQSFATSADALSSLADEALAERRAGKTKPLDPDTLGLRTRRNASAAP